MQQAPDLETRTMLARRIHQRDRNEAHHIPIVNDRQPFGMTSKVKGFVRAADWMEDYKVVWKAE